MGGRGSRSGIGRESFSTLAERGEVHDVLGIDMSGQTTKTAQELKDIASQMDDIGVGGLSRMSNPDKIAQKIMESVGKHTFEKAMNNHDWAIDTLAGMRAARKQLGISEILGVSKKLYLDKNRSKKWYRDWSKITHPDNNPGNPRAHKAFEAVNEYYDRMRRV